MTAPPSSGSFHTNSKSHASAGGVPFYSEAALLTSNVLGQVCRRHPWCKIHTRAFHPVREMVRVVSLRGLPFTYLKDYAVMKSSHEWHVCYDSLELRRVG